MARTDTGEDALAAARALGPQILAGREEMEAERRLPRSLVGAMKAAGVFRLSMPRAMGGPELTPMAQVRVVKRCPRSTPASVGRPCWRCMPATSRPFWTQARREACTLIWMRSPAG